MTEPDDVYQRGDFVMVSAAGEQIAAMVTLASPNGKSLIVMFDGVLDGHVGMMPIARDDDGFMALVSGQRVVLRRIER